MHTFPGVVAPATFQKNVATMDHSFAALKSHHDGVKKALSKEQTRNSLINAKLDKIRRQL